MANVSMMRKREELLENNIATYVQEHPGEYVLIEGWGDVSFHSTQDSLNSATKKYEGKFGPGYLSRKLPTSLEEIENRLS